MVPKVSFLVWSDRILGCCIQNC